MLHKNSLSLDQKLLWKSGMMMVAEIPAGKSEAQGQPLLYSGLKANLRYIRPCHKKSK